MTLLLWAALTQAFFFNETTRGWLAAINLLPNRPMVAATLMHGVLTAVVAALIVGRGLFADAASFAAIPSLRRVAR